VYDYRTEDELRRLSAKVVEPNAGRSAFVRATSFWKMMRSRELLEHVDRTGAGAVKHLGERELRQ
jgi:hypothetical protein